MTQSSNERYEVNPSFPSPALDVERMREALKPFVRAFDDAREKYAKRYGVNQGIGYSNFDAMPDKWPMEGLKFDMGTFRAATRALLSLSREREGEPQSDSAAAGGGALVEFARYIIKSYAWGQTVDGGDVQDTAERLGLIVEVPYDPAIHGENDCDAQPGDPWFEFCRSLKQEGGGGQ